MASKICGPWHLITLAEVIFWTRQGVVALAENNGKWMGGGVA
jgi:hypothetical protein